MFPPKKYFCWVKQLISHKIIRLFPIHSNKNIHVASDWPPRHHPTQQLVISLHPMNSRSSNSLLHLFISNHFSGTYQFQIQIFPPEIHQKSTGNRLLRDGPQDHRPLVVVRHLRGRVAKGFGPWAKQKGNAMRRTLEAEEIMSEPGISYIYV